jgi:hypothetical protein
VSARSGAVNAFDLTSILSTGLWPPFPGLWPEVLILSIHGLAILSCPECSTQVRWPPSAPRRVFL